MEAIRNATHGVAIVHLLGAWKNGDLGLGDKNHNNDNALQQAMTSTGEMLSEVGKLYVAAGLVAPCKDALAQRLPPMGCADPVGLLREAAQWGCLVNSVSINGLLSSYANLRKFHPDIWALMRCANGRGPTLLNMESYLGKIEPVPTRLWRWFDIECGSKRTLLHSAVRLKSLSLLQFRMDEWLNPFLRDENNNLPIDYAAEAGPSKDLYAALWTYMRQPLRREIMDWYGPYFLGRVRTFLCILGRWRKSDLRMGPLVPPRDVISLILDRVRASEYV
jgi:hypothetical protein